MKKIFQIAGYDFRRLMLNPITILVVVGLLIASLIFSATYKIPTTPKYEAVTAGQTPSEIFSNFNSQSTDIDTKQSMDKLIAHAQTLIDTQKNCDHLNQLTQLNNKFADIKEELQWYAGLGSESSKYIQDGIGEIIETSDQLKLFIENYKNLDEFESNIFFTKETFASLQKISEFFDKTTHQNIPVKQILDELYKNLQQISNFEQIVTDDVTTWAVDNEQLESFQTEIVNVAKQKTEAIYQEMQTYVSAGTSADQLVNDVKSLITNYRLTCESANFSVNAHLKLLLSSHFGNLDIIFGYSNFNEEDLQQSLTKTEYFLKDNQLFYTAYQQPLNFNIAQTQITPYDNTYFIISIIGFLTIIFGIFCAYKLFGLDRRNGKLDVILSQNVSFGQVFAGKFTAIVLCTSTVLSIFMISILVWSMLFYSSLPNGILAVFNLKTPYIIQPFLFLLIKFVGIELQVIFWSIGTVFLMNISRKFDLLFVISLIIFAAVTICNIFLNGSLVYCLFPFIHTDLTAFLGGGSINAGFLQTPLYAFGNFFISLGYYLVVVVLIYNFTNQLFKKN